MHSDEGEFLGHCIPGRLEKSYGDTAFALFVSMGCPRLVDTRTFAMHLPPASLLQASADSPEEQPVAGSCHYSDSVLSHLCSRSPCQSAMTAMAAVVLDVVAPDTILLFKPATLLKLVVQHTSNDTTFS